MSAIEVIFLSVSCLTAATGLMITALNPWRTINQAYAIVASLSALWLFCIFMAIHAGLGNERQTILFWLRMGNGCGAFLPWSYALVKIAITESGSLAHLVKRSWQYFLAGCLLTVLVYTVLYIPDMAALWHQRRGFAYAIYVLCLASLCILILRDACTEMRSCSGVRFLEIKFFVINICLSTLIVLASFAASSLFGVGALRYIGPFVVVVSFGLTIWAICYHRVFAARQVFTALGRRLSTLLVLAGCIFIADSYLLQHLPRIVSLLISACAGGLLSTYWDRKVCVWLGLDPKELLATPRAQIIDWARNESDADKLTLQFETFLRDWCQAESVTFHTIDSQESPGAVLKTSAYALTYPFLRQTGYVTPETLARRRPDQEIHASKAVLTERNLAALIAVPRGSHFPSCIVGFGHKLSLRPYTYPDIQLLIELVELMDNILTQARVAARTAQIEKMESAAMMSRGLAHDLNNLATPVSTFLVHMEDQVKPGGAEAEVLADAKHSIRVMQDYIRESLFFARRLVPDFHLLSASELLDSTIKLTQTRAQNRGIRVATDQVPDASFTADRALMLRLLQNLVLNGIDATPRGGKVTLSATALDHGRITFSVADEGPGVPPDIADRIFEPYFTTKDTGDEVRGLGLGLAICLKISGLHGGGIHVGRAASGGALFTATLPVNPKLSLDATPSPARSSSANVPAQTTPSIGITAT